MQEKQKVDACFLLLKTMYSTGSHHITSHNKSYSAQSYRLKIDRLCIRAYNVNVNAKTNYQMLSRTESDVS